MFSCVWLYNSYISTRSKRAKFIQAGTKNHKEKNQCHDFIQSNNLAYMQKTTIKNNGTRVWNKTQNIPPGTNVLNKNKSISHRLLKFKEKLLCKNNGDTFVIKKSQS